MVLQVIGKFLISVGVGILLFVAWTLWGTGFYTSQQQDELNQQFEQDLAADDGDETGRPPRGFVRSLRPGDAVFRLRIPRIDLSQIVVEGVGTEELRKGPGHYPQCRRLFPEPLCTDFPEKFPGQEGRVIVSGHRTTYGAPFWDLDKMRRGDEIITQTRWGDFTYEVTRTKIVDASDLSIVLPSDRAEIVLTTCNPRFSAAQRLIVYAEMATA